MASATPDLWLPSKASPPIGWYQIILLGDRDTCVNYIMQLHDVALRTRIFTLELSWNWQCMNQKSWLLSLCTCCVLLAICYPSCALRGSVVSTFDQLLNHWCMTRPSICVDMLISTAEQPVIVSWEFSEFEKVLVPTWEENSFSNALCIRDHQFSQLILLCIFICRRSMIMTAVTVVDEDEAGCCCS